MVTTLSKILFYVPNCNVKIDCISYETEHLGFCEIEGHIVDRDGGLLTPVVIPISLSQLPEFISSVSEENKVSPQPTTRRLRSNVSNEKK